MLLLAALLGLSGVALGAFGAHALAASVPEASLGTWRTAVQYQLVHALALLALALAPVAADGALAPGFRRAGFCFFIGVLLFSGSLYGLVLGGPRWLGPITPLGGLAMMLGWAMLGWTALRRDGQTAA